MNKKVLLFLITLMYAILLSIFRLPFWQGLDETITIFVVDHRIPVLTSFLSLFTHLASSKVIIVLLIVIMLICVKYNKRNLGFLYLAASSLSALLNTVLKNIIQRSRPPYSPLHIETSFSFPSGHSCAIFIIISLSLFLLANTNLPKWTKSFAYSIGFLMIILIGFSRIYLGVHWFTDIIAGYLTAAYSLYIIIFLYLNVYLKKEY